jgi:hypothetical protein
MPIRDLVLKFFVVLLFSWPAFAVTKVSSTVALEVTTPLTVSYGEAIDGLAQVTASDGSAVTGSITFYDGTTSFCTLPLTNGASCPEGTDKSFAAGAHLFTAVYSGDATHAGATSNAVTVAVKQDTTATAVASSANPMAVGGQVVYTASVAGAHGPVAGTVTFLDGAAKMGSVAVDGNGGAMLSVLMLVAGDHAITAAYAGNANSAGSTSAVLHEMVQGTLEATTTTVTASANPVTAGTSVTLTAKVAAAGATAAAGMVSFVEGGTVLGSARVSAGTATWSTSALSAGSHSIVAQYAGDAWTGASVSPALSVAVNAQSAPGGVTLGVAEVTVAAGDTASIPVTLSGAAGQAKATSLSCSGLPEEASCTLVSGSSANGTSAATLRITTSAPRDCGSSVPYGDTPASPAKSAVLPVAGLLLLLVPRRRWAKSLLAVICAVAAMGAMTGCGTGNCTDLGTRPGSYMVTVTGSVGGTQVSQKVKLVVTP